MDGRGCEWGCAVGAGEAVATASVNREGVGLQGGKRLPPLVTKRTVGLRDFHDVFYHFIFHDAMPRPPEFFYVLHPPHRLSDLTMPPTPAVRQVLGPFSEAP